MPSLVEYLSIPVSRLSGFSMANNGINTCVDWSTALAAVAEAGVIEKRFCHGPTATAAAGLEWSHKMDSHSSCGYYCSSLADSAEANKAEAAR